MNDKFHYELKSNGYTMSLETDTPITDITFQTDAAAYWRFYNETRQQIYDLEKKRDLYAHAYYNELLKADIPYFIDHRLLKDITNANPTDKDKRNARDFAIAQLIENLFSEEFRKKHDIVFSNIATEGYEARSYMVTFTIGRYEYRLTCPQPKNMKSSYFKGNGICESNQMYTAHYVDPDASDELSRYYRLLGKSSYDWKDCAKAIEEHVAKTTTTKKGKKNNGNA